MAVYRRSPTEVWVYDTRPEVGVGAHQLDPQAVGLVRHTRYGNQVEPTEVAGKYDEKQLAAWDDTVARGQRSGIELVVVVHGNPPGVSYANRAAG